MPKLKPSSKNNKPKVIFIYGPIAAGKLTVAREVEKLTGIQLVHNHAIIDFTKEIFPEHESKPRHALAEKMHFETFKTLLQEGTSFIFTLAYAKSYVSRTGLSDPALVKKLAAIVEKNGGVFCPVQLLPEKKEVLKRVTAASRKEFGKLRDLKIMKMLTDREGMFDHGPFKNNFVIDNTSIPAKKAAQMIVEKFGL